jgi:hypothetical protein
MVGFLVFLFLSTSVHPSSAVGFELSPDGSEVCVGFVWGGVVRLAESFLLFSFSLILSLRLDISASNCCSLVFWVDRFFLLLLRFFDSPRFLPIFLLHPLSPVGGSPEFPPICKSRPLSGAPIPALFGACWLSSNPPLDINPSDFRASILLIIVFSKSFYLSASRCLRSSSNFCFSARFVTVSLSSRASETILQ